MTLRPIGFMRSPLRLVLTVVAVAITLVAFVLLRSLNASWSERVRQTPNNRVVTRHKVGWAQSMPFHYAQVIREVPGVKHAMGARWAGLKLPGDNAVFFDSFAVEAQPFVDMHYEIAAPEEQKRAFVADRQGALVSVQLASLSRLSLMPTFCCVNA